MKACIVNVSSGAAQLAGLHGWAGASLSPPAADVLQAPEALERPPAQVWVASDADQPDRALASLRLQRGIGLARPRAWYRLGWAVHAAAELRLFQQQRTLLLGNDLTGADELTGFVIAPGLPDPLAQALWKALAAAALQALATQPGDRLAPCVAELPGVLDAQGQSPFWLGLGRHFYARDLAAARQAHGSQFDSDVAALLPRQPMYASFLPAAAQAVMGQCRSAAQPLQAALHSLGFRWRDHIAVTDGAPVVERDAV